MLQRGNVKCFSIKFERKKDAIHVLRFIHFRGLFSAGDKSVQAAASQWRLRLATTENMRLGKGLLMFNALNLAEKEEECDDMIEAIWKLLGNILKIFFQGFWWASKNVNEMYVKYIDGT